MKEPFDNLSTLDRAHIIAALGMAYERAYSEEVAGVFLELYRRLGGKYHAELWKRPTQQKDETL